MRNLHNLSKIYKKKMKVLTVIPNVVEESALTITRI